MDFPATPPVECEPLAGLDEALGVEPRWLGRSRFDVLVEVADEAAVRAARPDFHRLAGVEARGVMLTAVAAPGSPHDFVSRFFAPRSGVAEDPVTGSAHCALGPYWSAKLGKRILVGYQASPRGGFVTVTANGPRTTLSGRAKTVLVGTLLP
jgi:PhzF family phenazine biosynthesis protein